MSIIFVNVCKLLSARRIFSMHRRQFIIVNCTFSTFSGSVNLHLSENRNMSVVINTVPASNIPDKILKLQNIFNILNSYS